MEETGWQVDDGRSSNSNTHTHTVCLVEHAHVETFAFTQQAHEHSGKEAKEEKEGRRRDGIADMPANERTHNGRQ